MRKAKILLAVAVLAGAGLFSLNDSQQAGNLGHGRAFAENIQVSMPKEAVGFNGTLLAQLVKPVANNCFTIRVAKVICFTADNKTQLDAPALSAVWNGKYVWCGPAANATPCPPLKVGDIVVVAGYQNEMHIRYSSVARPEKPKPAGPGGRPKPQDSPASVTAQRDVEYAAVGNKHLLLDVYTPTVSQGKVPLVVWIHGGAWRTGAKENPRALSLVGRGYAVASINYRLSQEAIFPAQIEDCKAAIRFLRANAAKYSIDGDHIGVWGDSAGGHLVALLGTSGDVKELEGTVGDNRTVPSRVQCVVDFYGPSDMLQFENKPTWVRVDQPNSPLVQLVGGPLAMKKTLVAKANPITYVTRDDPPFLVAHGDKDNTVPFNQSELLVAALKKAGVDVTFEVVKGGGHGFTPTQFERILPIVTAFFDKHLKGAAAVKNGP